ncbi:addiction module antidote protein [Rugamonas sp.]|uniref:addiction module antidote protein n=1 Tax=Rugamonas sp. TaxID=1926287 RepID=UPI0025DFD53E|nr:addiction module antidote protein [Rugamonas sp.]
MALKLNRWDGAEHLRTKEDMARYFAACMEEAADDTAFIVESLRLLARAKGMTDLAKEAGLSREELSEDGILNFGTFIKVMRALGLQFHVKSTTQSAA